MTIVVTSQSSVTGGDIIKIAMKMAGILGVGQTASAEDANDALTILNAMLSQWQRKRWLVYSLDDIAFQANGAQSYTVGPGGQININRPDRIESAFVRLLNGGQQVDYMLDVVQAREDYNEIALKQLKTFPQIAFYDAAYPLGNLYIWPAPTSQYEIHISIKTRIGQFASLTTTMGLPPEYLEAIYWNLAARLRPMYGLQPEQTVVAMAKQSLNVIRNANTQIPRLNLPPSVTRDNIYNIYGDQNY